MKNYIAYAVSIVVIVLVVLLIVFIPAPESVKSLFSLPGVIALFMLLVQGWKDQVAHERALEIQKKQHDFSLAIASHMANVVFDKQVEFCEKYAKKINSIIFQMFHEGPTQKGLSYAAELREIRVEFSPWISKELTQKVKKIEFALLEVASLEVVGRLGNGPNRPEYIERMYNAYTKFLGVNMEGLPREPESAADVVLQYFAEVLNTFELEALRRKAILMAKSQN